MKFSLLEQYFCDRGALLAYLFGSTARGENTAESDCDIAVLMPDPLDPKEALSIAARMERDLRPLCDAAVDLVFLNLASPLLRFEVIRNARVLYSSDERMRLEYEIRARDAYEDFAYIQSFFVRALKERLSS